MFKLFKCLHFIGLTLFLGSIWIYIAMGTPLESALITAYVRHSVNTLVLTITIPGLLMMIISGIIMAILKNKTLSRKYLITKIGLTTFVVIMTYFITKSIRLSSHLADQLPTAIIPFNQALNHEVIYGAINVILILATIGYAIYTTKYRSRGVI